MLEQKKIQKKKKEPRDGGETKVRECELKRKGCEKGKLGSVGAGRPENDWYVDGCKETGSVDEDSTSIGGEEIRWEN